MKKSCLFLFLISLFVFQTLSALAPGEIGYLDEPVMPEGRIGQRIRSIIRAINSDDPEVIRRFMTDECTEKFLGFMPMERWIGSWRSIFHETGGLDFHSIRTYEPEREETVVILRDRTIGGWHAIVISFDDTNDSLVSGLNYNTARTPTNFEEESLDEKQLIKKIDELMDSVIGRGMFSGTLLVAKGDEVLLERVGGEASKRFHVPNRIDTKFNLGSMNKMFTATAVVQLEEKGLLSFDDPISKYVDESWLPEEVASKITVHHLLTHTSGLGSYFNEDFMKGSRTLYRDIDDFKPLVKDDGPAFEPGSQWQYSNNGMLLLGVVIESASGMDYFEYIRKNIYEPSGMKDSDCYEMDSPVENLAIGYVPAPDNPWGWRNNYFTHSIKGGPAGGGFSTVRDLHRFALAMLGGELVSDESRNRMWSIQGGAYYGYGHFIEEYPGGKVVGHGGGASGINSNLDIFTDKGYIVAVMSNVDKGASPLAGRIKEMIKNMK